METRTVQYTDSDYEVSFKVEQATLSKQYMYEALQSLAQKKYDIGNRESEDGLTIFSRRFYMLWLYPALKTVVTKVEDKKENFPDITEETMDNLPVALAFELRDAIYELNPHWSPFFVRTKQTGNG